VSVGDFGLALDADEDDGVGFATAIAAHSLTMTGHVLGTPAYMSPEQAVGESTAASDQFAFCVTVYEALFGTRPFPGATFDQILDRVDAGAIEPPKRKRRVSASVMSALRQGLSAKPEARFGSMRELIGAMNVHRKIANAVVTFDDFVLVDADGTETRLVARVARPEREQGEWVCPVEIDGLQPQTKIRGETAFQALSLGLTFVRRRFIHLAQQGARLYFADTTARDESLNEVAIRALLGEA
jgi:serine/threonine protein kinase